ncbi:MAG: TonB C-terminal domain-containing protein [Limisphaerales bacterium]
MLPHTQVRKKRNSSQVNLLISFAVHALIVLVALYFAARGGLLGKQIQKISVEMVKEKRPEKPKPLEKPKPPKEQPKIVAAPKEASSREAPPAASQPTVAPPAAELPSFVFEGGKTVESSSDPVQLYKGLLEYAFRSKWDRPQNMHDDDYVAKVQVTVDRKGHISNVEWLAGSGNARWDDSVRHALTAVTHMDQPPPTNFPPNFVIRFDVHQETEPVLQ